VKIHSKTEPCSKCGHQEVKEFKLYFWVNTYPDGRPGELFITRDETGSEADGMADCLAIAISIGLQHGVPLDDYGRKLIRQRFLPAGLTDNPEIRTCLSIPDYIFTWAKKQGLWKED